MTRFGAEIVSKVRQLELAYHALQPWRWVTRPVFEGLEQVPSHSRVMFVGNHTLFGVLDAPLLMAELWRQCGVWPRALGDYIHFKVPGWREFLTSFDVVEGTREKCAEVMAQAHPILVFPGGAREVAKRRGEKYQLIWKNRTGFVRMALQFGYTIVPFAAVGVEDAFDIRFDANDLQRSPLGSLLRATGLRDDLVWPIATGLGPTPLPRPERLYFRIGAPIETEHLSEHYEDKEVQLAVREQVKVAVEEGIALLRDKQAQDPERTTWTNPLRRWLSSRR